MLAGLETVVIPLLDDLPFLELEKHGKKGLHLPSSRNGSKGYVVSYLLLYLKHLARHDLFAPFRPLQGRSQVAPLAEALATALLDPGRRSAAAKHNWKVIEERGRWEVNMGRMEKAYRDLAAATSERVDRVP